MVGSGLLNQKFTPHRIQLHEPDVLRGEQNQQKLPEGKKK